MIDRLRIENFKALDSLVVEFSGFNMLIGENSCGKSTILQALDFLCSIVTRDIDEYLDERDWSFEEIRSQLSSPGSPIAFSLDYTVGADACTWSISINQREGQWEIQESITKENATEPLLSFGGRSQDRPLDFSHMNLKSSALKALNVEKGKRGDGVFAAPVVSLKAMLTSSSSFELLSPEKMRGRGSRGTVDSIGIGGEKLAAYIHGFASKRKGDLSRCVSHLIGHEVKVSTTTKGRPGWLDLSVEEIWGPTHTSIDKRYLSDGLLRILALSAILVGADHKKSRDDGVSSLILLDEIEDGINPALAEELITRFRELTRWSGYQVMITSHSPVMVNYADSDEIIYLWRDETGHVRSENLFSSEATRELLEFFNPGEVWLNYDKEDLVGMIQGRKAGTDD